MSSSTEEVSIYNLVEHPDFKFQIGDIVVRLPGNNDVEGDARPEQWCV